LVLKVGRRRRCRAGSGKKWDDERRLAVVGNKWEPTAAVVAVAGGKGERREQ
jgi:hypothetical protein